ncbi:uncharacterized protein LOC126745458 isoform X1 [Anthonomus grandis grandis]|uniref:uncharacterized protein LOC126745458 isoform X1 n=1 Tax=Anthonomus grandis grandis TaxID=2921223 RepID=UPI00216699B2|nr:uncharacterized protein LOC126745458 isoform X1 [Anthonomus grandis grandis]XP_050309272.1 uncharacterized protein LOC126745458 isoform X1 [Anthonomus grandis grandis]
MLYVPWRNEVDEVEHVDQQMKYVDRYAEIVENRRKFNVLDEKILDEALQCAQDRTDNLINNGFEGNIDNEYMAYAIDNPDYNPFDGIDGNQNEAPVKHMAFPTPHQIPDSEYVELISKLNQKQYEFLNIVQDQLLEKQSFYCVLSGPAGTGKSHLITAITQTLLRHYNSIPGNKPESIKVLLAAPTGKAAFNIGGITLHSALSLPVNQYDDDLIPLSHETVNTIYSALCELKLIIIDEYSMVGAKMFGHVNSRLQQIFKSDEAFGNIPIVMCGDSRQLPPVGDSFLFLPSKRNPYKEICGTYLWDLFKYFELTEIMRQSNDKSFAIALNNMACGAMTDDDVKLIKSREVPTDFQIPEDTIHLFSYNSDVDAYNNEKLSTYNTERSVSEAKDVVKGSCSEKLKTLFLEYAKGLKKSESFGLMLTVTLQLNAKYMISLNIDTKDGLVNGATGALRKIEYDHNQIPNRVWIEFFDTKTGIDCRNKHKAHMEAHNIPTTWTPILKTARAIKIQKGSNVHVERLQFPLLISEGITIHKSQGATYEQVVVHIRKQMSRSSVYVACSRVTKLSGLYIIGQFKAPRPPTDKDVAFKELKNLQTNKLLISRYENQFVKDVHVKNVIAYQNVQSLSKNLKFIKNNPIFKDAHLLFFVETWLHKNNTTNIEINGFECFANLFSNENVSKPFGIICYKKKDLTAKISSINKYTKNFSGIVFQAVTFLLNDIFVMVVYNPPKLTILQAQRCLSDIIFGQQGRILIIGDFNQDIINETQNGLKMTLNFKGLTSKLSVDESTTKSNTQIDWLFSNFKNLQHFIYNTVYSHHKAIVVSIYDKDFIPTLPKTVNESKKVSQKLHFNVKNTNNNNQYLATQASLQEDEESINNDDDIILSSDDESIPHVYSTPPSLMNRDNVSCYANSVLQSLLCLPEIRDSISKRNTNINSRIHDIMLKRTNSAMAVRQLLGGIFLRQEQQDAEEFCRKLLRKLDVDDVQIHINARAHLDVKHCENCNINEYGINDMVSIYIAYFPENCGNNINFELMFIPRQSELICQNCSNNLTTFSKLTFVSKYLVLQLQRSQIRNGRSVKINTTFSNFNNQNVVLDNFRFKVKCVIKHHGQEITSGHYTSVVNINNQWWNCDDNNIGTILIAANQVIVTRFQFKGNTFKGLDNDKSIHQTLTRRLQIEGKITSSWSFGLLEI